MVKKRGLGKSLDALLAYTDSDSLDTLVTLEDSAERLVDLPLAQIHRGKYQPRREIDAESLEELASSIRTQGIIQPIVVRPEGEKYEIIAGERRWRAAALAGLSEIPAIIRDISDEAAIAIALIENIQRENLNPIEEALALNRLIAEFGLTHQEVASAVGKSRVSVSNLLRLLTLPEKVKILIEKRRLEMGHARALITLEETNQMKAVDIIIDKGLSVRETENLVRILQATPPQKSQAPKDPDIVRLQKSLSEQFNLAVAVYCNAKGKGKIVIHYRNLTELDSLLATLQPA